ncbi:MAG: DNA polymerase III subunit chi [Pseudomonadota bacterium]
MSRVDFYVLPGSGAVARHNFACRLAEKAYRLNHRVHICLGDAQAASQLDDQLWTFRDGSFVPHEVVSGSTPNAQSPVTLGHGAPPKLDVDLLINLTEEIPPQSASFPRIAEIVTSDDDCRRQSRQHYAQYRELGCELETHKL